MHKLSPNVIHVRSAITPELQQDLLAEILRLGVACHTSTTDVTAAAAADADPDATAAPPTPVRSFRRVLRKNSNFEILFGLTDERLVERRRPCSSSSSASPPPSVVESLPEMLARALVMPTTKEGESSNTTTQDDVNHILRDYRTSFVDCFRYSAPDGTTRPSGTLRQHVDMLPGWVLIVSLGCTAVFWIQEPEDGRRSQNILDVAKTKRGPKRRIELRSGDVVLFDACAAANVLHGIERVLPETCPEYLPPDDARDWRFCVQYRQYRNVDSAPAQGEEKVVEMVTEVEKVTKVDPTHRALALENLKLDQLDSLQAEKVVRKITEPFGILTSLKLPKNVGAPTVVIFATGLQAKTAESALNELEVSSGVKLRARVLEVSISDQSVAAGTTSKKKKKKSSGQRVLAPDFNMNRPALASSEILSDDKVQ